VTLKEQDINIHKVFYSDIYECNKNFSIYKNKESYMVYQWNSDGAGAYQVVWVFSNKGLEQRLVGSMF
jgi:hypothetical protein